jgi:glycosyltransferase involved in cell wall biosynthesis
MVVKRIAIVSKTDPKNIRGWSGMPYYMAAELQRRFDETNYFFPPNIHTNKLGKLIVRAKNRLIQRRPKTRVHHFEIIQQANALSKQIRTTNSDAVFVIGMDNISSRLDVDIPIIYHSDTTLALMIDYYPAFKSMSRRSIKISHSSAKKIISNAAIKIYPSQWAKNSAIQDYNADPTSVFTVPYGANIDHIPSRQDVLTEKPHDCCQLLMVGGDWDRKGGDIAVQTVEELARRGIPCNFNVIGNCPIEHPLVNSVGYLNKASLEENKRYRDLWAQSHFFLLPTKAECFGMVFSEAAAWGLPSISTSTGGIPDAIKNNETGKLLPVDSSPELFAETIEHLWNDTIAYKSMSTKARDRFESTLNWSSWGEETEKIIREY